MKTASDTTRCVRCPHVPASAAQASPCRVRERVFASTIQRTGTGLHRGRLGHSNTAAPAKRCYRARKRAGPHEYTAAAEKHDPVCRYHCSRGPCAASCLLLYQPHVSVVRVHPPLTSPASTLLVLGAVASPALRPGRLAGGRPRCPISVLLLDSPPPVRPRRLSSSVLDVRHRP